MMTMVAGSMALFLGLGPVVGADWFSESDTAGMLIPKGLTPLYEKPAPGGLPVSYCEPSDTCLSDSAVEDSSGTMWLLVNCSSKFGWVRKTSMVPPRPREEAAESTDASRRIEPDAKRRYRILEKHPDWPRRIVKVVREGKICLDMNADQLQASWGEPAQKSRAFILGAGTQDVWLYRNGDGSSLVVFLVKGRVVGWSE